SVRPGATFDLQVIRGLQTGCRPVLPDRGIYPDLIPANLKGDCLYHFSVEALASALREAINPGYEWSPPDLRQSFKPYEAIAATRNFDERLSQLAVGNTSRS